MAGAAKAFSYHADFLFLNVICRRIHCKLHMNPA